MRIHYGLSGVCLLLDINCKDKYAFCKRWSQLGYCKKIKRVRKLCKGSCDENCKLKPSRKCSYPVILIKVVKWTKPLQRVSNTLLKSIADLV